MCIEQSIQNSTARGQAAGLQGNKLMRGLKCDLNTKSKEGKCYDIKLKGEKHKKCKKSGDICSKFQVNIQQKDVLF